MILHVDMDAFYASVEELDRPELVGKPVIVAGDPRNRGVVSAANYAARAFGVHSAMPSATAHRLCPHGVFLPVRMDRYVDVSHEIRRIFHRYTPLVEPLSLDEAFLDVSGSVGLFGPAEQIGHGIKREIRDELQLVASVGVAPNKYLAKIASDLDKPDGFVVVDENNIQAFLDPLPVSRIWGVGRVSNQVLDRLGIRTIGQLRDTSLELLREKFGNMGDHLWQLAHGIDDRSVVPDHEAKSISHETTFADEIADAELLRGCLLHLSEQVARRLRGQGLLARTVHIKVRFADFQTITRNKTLAEATDLTDELWYAAADMLANRLPKNHPPVRLLGMGVSGFDNSGQSQGLLFDQEQRARQGKLDTVTDEILDRFGQGSIGRAGIMDGKDFVDEE
ncbi:MAG: DNA polymerase IV [Planctomycetota bacterium]|nr:DNA polymerase IV [Planctomycetota bacterium]